MSVQWGLFLDKIEMPGAILSREPYFISASTDAAGNGGGEVTSRIFKHLNRKHPLSLGGIPLIPVGDHGKWATVSLRVMESDAGMRKLGRALQLGKRALGRSDKGVALLAKMATLNVAGVAVSAGLKIVGKALRENGDDLLMELELLIRFEHGYCLLPPTRSRRLPTGHPSGATIEVQTAPEQPCSWVVENEKVRLTLRIAQSADDGREDGLHMLGFAKPRSLKSILQHQSVRLMRHGVLYVGRFIKAEGQYAILSVRRATTSKGNGEELIRTHRKAFMVREYDEHDLADYLRVVMGPPRFEGEGMGQRAWHVLSVLRPEITEAIDGDPNSDYDDFVAWRTVADESIEAGDDRLPDFLARVAGLWERP